MTLLKDLIDIPERVQKGDFVVRLTEGVNRADFSALSEGTSSSSGWGELAAGWDAERFENAIIAESGSEERSQLIGALIDQFFRSYDTQAGGQGEAFLSLDKGCL